MEDTKTITLRKPIDFEGRTIDKLELSEPTAGQMEKAAAGANGIASNLILIAEVASIPLGAVRLLKKRDLEAAVDYLSGFRNDAPPTGGASSRG